ncbi:hypothetical protein [Streptomyces sp. NPDC046925]|uniref:hypothetical protein n=1 Tax=Streptomyces sp. NPDC046925 TaxID=3155375 RepID=UPI0033FBE42A
MTIRDTWQWLVFFVTGRVPGQERRAAEEYDQRLKTPPSKEAAAYLRERLAAGDEARRTAGTCGRPYQTMHHGIARCVRESGHPGVHEGPADGGVFSTWPRDADQPVLLSEGKRVAAPEEAEALGLTGGARRMRDPRQPAYDAVYTYIRSSNRVPGDVVTRNAMIWQAVTAALDALGAGGDGATACLHYSVYFDRTVCPEPCASMHDRCAWCGEAVGGCLNERIADGIEAARRGETHDLGDFTQYLSEDQARATDCERCGGPIDWIDCPTGGWWAHRLHPADHHDAEPPLRARYVVALKSELDEEPRPATAERLADAVVEVNEAAAQHDTVPVPRAALERLVQVARHVAASEPYPDPVPARGALADLYRARLIDQLGEDGDG